MPLIGFGVRNRKPQVFSFVICTDGAWRFCESGAEVMHATMCNVAEEVFFAGEFFCRFAEGRHWLVVTNNSGTYRPQGSALDSVAALLTEVLGDGLDVEPMLQDDPRFKEYTRKYRGDHAHMGYSVHHQPKAPTPFRRQVTGEADAPAIGRAQFTHRRVRTDGGQPQQHSPMPPLRGCPTSTPPPPSTLVPSHLSYVSWALPTARARPGLCERTAGIVLAHSPPAPAMVVASGSAAVPSARPGVVRLSPVG